MITKLKFEHDKFLNEETISLFLGKEQIGEARIEYPGEKGAYLSGLEIDENYHGHNYGRKFVEHIEKYLKRKKFKKLYLSPNTYVSQKFWEHMGYRWDKIEQGAMSRSLR